MILKKEGIEAEEELMKEYQLSLSPQAAQFVSCYNKFSCSVIDRVAPAVPPRFLPASVDARP